MKKIKVLLALIGFALMATMTPLASHADDFVIDIDVSPNVINIGSSSTWVTVHADIPYDVVNASSVVLIVGLSTFSNDLCFADDRGNLVAKFDINVVKKQLKDLGTIDDLFTFALSGLTKAFDGNAQVPFYGEQDIRVFDNSGKPGKM